MLELLDEELSLSEELDDEELLSELEELDELLLLEELELELESEEDWASTSASWVGSMSLSIKAASSELI